MAEAPTFRGGRNIAMKVPAHQFEATVEAYRQLGIPILERSDSTVSFDFGPIRLHVDRVTNLSQAEIWLEFIATDALAGADRLELAGFVRCDDVEVLPADFAGFWVTSPSSIVHLVTEME